MQEVHYEGNNQHRSEEEQLSYVSRGVGGGELGHCHTINYSACGGQRLVKHEEEEVSWGRWERGTSPLKLYTSHHFSTSPFVNDTMQLLGPSEEH